nr:MAG TPA: hypothetical protein [Caudoviricetes sp.]
MRCQSLPFRDRKAEQPGEHCFCKKNMLYLENLILD